MSDIQKFLEKSDGKGPGVLDNIRFGEDEDEDEDSDEDEEYEEEEEEPKNQLSSSAQKEDSPKAAKKMSFSTPDGQTYPGEQSVLQVRNPVAQLMPSLW